ncbi:MAG: hypothetical protein LBO71_01420 [Prevotellaceae bacterium]|nr:hypothetical protein [Prevotellaceae bacterium]
MSTLPPGATSKAFSCRQSDRSARGTKRRSGGISPAKRSPITGYRQAPTGGGSSLRSEWRRGKGREATFERSPSYAVLVAIVHICFFRRIGYAALRFAPGASPAITAATRSAIASEAVRNKAKLINKTSAQNSTEWSTDGAAIFFTKGETLWH